MVDTLFWINVLRVKYMMSSCFYDHLLLHISSFVLNDISIPYSSVEKQQKCTPFK